VSTGRDRGNPHDWNSLDSYLFIHETYMQQFMDDGFVVENSVTAIPLGTPPREVILRGRIRCQHGLFVDVLKILEVDNRNGKLYVRTSEYHYHAGVGGEEDRAIFRYDNAHSYLGHGDAHHKHRFDHFTWERIEPPEWVGQETWPHLNEVIEELRTWWYEIGQNLHLEESARHQ
jgi:hypothetical protein